MTPTTIPAAERAYYVAPRGQRLQALKTLQRMVNKELGLKKKRRKKRNLIGLVR